jgi:hypothetical protein
MTKRNITLVGIALILLIAIGITINLGGLTPSLSSVGALQPRTHTLETLGLEQASLALPLLDKSLDGLKYELKTDLKDGLKNGLKYELKDGLKYELKTSLKSLTASASRLKPELGLSDLLLDVASASQLEDNLSGLLPTA